MSDAIVGCAELLEVSDLNTDPPLQGVGQANPKLDDIGVQKSAYGQCAMGAKSAAGVRGCFDEQSVAESEF